MYTKPTEAADVVRGAETRKSYDRPKLTNLGKLAHVTQKSGNTTDGSSRNKKN